MLDLEQFHALKNLEAALTEATEKGLLDKLGDVVHPDTINKFCDSVETLVNENPFPTILESDLEMV